MIQLAVFDMAGTTVVDNNFVAQAFCKSFEQHTILISEETVNPLMGYPKPIAIQMVLEHQGHEADKELVDAIHATFVEEMLDFYEYAPDVKPMPGAEALFLFLKEKGVKVALNTGFSRNIAGVIVARFQWQERGLVDEYIGSDEVAEGRPSADMINALKRRLRIGAEAEVMKVGDTVVDILEGKTAGCTYTIAVTTGAATKEELEPFQPTHIIHDLSQIEALFRESLQPIV
jgi:phosphonatase-like hydrolase